MVMFYREISDGQLGILLVSGRLDRVLAPGRHGFAPLSFRGSRRLLVLDADGRLDLPTEFESALMANRAAVGDAVLEVRNGDDEITLVSYDGTIQDLVAPGETAFFASRLRRIETTRISLGEPAPVPQDSLASIQRLSKDRAFSRYLLTFTVGERETGLLVADGTVVEQLKPGFYGYFRGFRPLGVEIVPMDEQLVTITNQEIMTKDRVSLRLSLLIGYRVVDALAARPLFEDGDASKSRLYALAQLAIRRAVASRNLDTLLSDKQKLEGELMEALRTGLADLGIKVSTFGVKDVILPGETREALGKVIEAQRLAEANNIRRREETAATRSLLNTARLMDDNPTLLRLKELETLERVVEKVDRISVNDGLPGLLQNLVRINSSDRES